MIWFVICIICSNNFQMFIEYYPTVDVDTGLPPQELDENVVTIIEKWESIDALKSHLVSPHMTAYREQVKEIVERLTVKVLAAA